MKSKLNISRFRCVWHPVSCWDQHNILLLLLYFDCVLKISKKKLVASLSKVNNQSQFDFIDTNWNFCFLFVCFFLQRPRCKISWHIWWKGTSSHGMQSAMYQKCIWNNLDPWLVQNTLPSRKFLTFCQHYLIFKSGKWNFPSSKPSK